VSNNKIITPISLKKARNDENYWAMFYHSLITAILHQKTLPYPWSQKLKSLQSYKGQIINSGFYYAMSGSVKNHGFEHLMVQFLRSKQGWNAFKGLCHSLLKDRGIKPFHIEYFSICKTGKDDSRHGKLLNHDTRNVNFILPVKTKNESGVISLPPNHQGRGIYELMMENSDVYVEITDGSNRFAFVGEVEGHKGDDMLNTNYFGGLKGIYSTFGIGASDRKTFDGYTISKPVSYLWNQYTKQWILHFNKSTDLYCDYSDTFYNLGKLMGGTHMSLDSDLRDKKAHLSVIKSIISQWDLDIQELLQVLSVSAKSLWVNEDIYNLKVTENGSLSFTPAELDLPDVIQYNKGI